MEHISYLLGFLMVASVSGCLRTEQSNTTKIWYTVRNNHKDYEHHFEFTTQLSRPKGDAVIEYMNQIARGNSVYNFTQTVFPGRLGASITSINGVYANHTAKMFWAFMKKSFWTECIMPVGVSSYIPHQNDHIVLSFENYDIFDWRPTRRPTCIIKQSKSESDDTGGH